MMQTCSHCSLPLDVNGNFCYSCGTPAVKTTNCPKCGKTIDGTSRFCKFCAFDLTHSIYDSTRQPIFTDVNPQSGKIHPGWITAAAVGLVLVIFSLTGFSYYFGLKEQLAKSEGMNQELQKQLDAKGREIDSKTDTISNLESRKTDLEGENTNLTDNLEKREKEVQRKSGEIKKLQGSLKTVSTCLVGVVRGITALQQNNEYQARQSLFEIQSTCEKSGDIIKQVEKF